MDRPLAMTGENKALARLDGAVKEYLPVTMLDWEGKVATVLFLSGCNFRCSFCHNPELVDHPEKIPPVPFAEIERHLIDKKGWIDGVVITGGEPTLCPNLRDIILKIRSMGLGVKLDTNGSRPEILNELFSEGLIDYVAMDIKTIFPKYQAVTKSSIPAETVTESINLIIRSNIDHEFRTTAYPHAVSFQDVEEIAAYLGSIKAKRFYIQQFKPDKTLGDGAANVKPYALDDLKRVAEVCNRYLPTKVR